MKTYPQQTNRKQKYQKKKDGSNSNSSKKE